MRRVALLFFIAQLRNFGLKKNLHYSAAAAARAAAYLDLLHADFPVMISIKRPVKYRMSHARVTRDMSHITCHTSLDECHTSIVTRYEFALKEQHCPTSQPPLAPPAMVAVSLSLQDHP
jgi:hypothetical protein